MQKIVYNAKIQSYLQIFFKHTHNFFHFIFIDSAVILLDAKKVVDLESIEPLKTKKNLVCRSGIIYTLKDEHVYEDKYVLHYFLFRLAILHSQQKK